MHDAPAVEGFTTESFTHAGASRVVYRRGKGPGVVVMHEVPGITPEVARFARLCADAGFTVKMPSLFGTPGRALSAGYAIGQLLGCCVSREFHVLAAAESSPIVDWLRALARATFAECGGKGVGAIGMCMTGNFALTMALDREMMAPVLGQPSLPFPFGRERRGAVHASPETLVKVRARVKDEGLKVLGLRFTHDPICRRQRFDRLRDELGEGFEAIEIDSGPKNAHGIKRAAHSVVTTELVLDREGHPTKVALDRVLSFFHERLD
jgi:dienelactone hydrolase